MRFLIDAQLPRTLAVYLQSAEYDAIYTLDLPDANASSDAIIIQMAAIETRIVITKDGDFVDSFLLCRLLSSQQIARKTPVHNDRQHYKPSSS
jgi:predicted nuclease of predicted toxin-antitoxin system